MDEDDFEGSIVLEKLAEQGLVEEFYQAIDEDNFFKATTLMRRADLDEDLILKTLSKLRELE